MSTINHGKSLVWHKFKFVVSDEGEYIIFLRIEIVVILSGKFG